ncbi:SDR family oxidoreductase [Mesobacillus thioparans]|uniref:SDR family oxidoreductase n=1 Tax=Mesobacillus thioparans TaxID=370439 RepID=UPI0039EFBBA1
MTILVTGFNGKVGYEVAGKLAERQLPFRCAVRNVEKAKSQFGDSYEFVELDFSRPETFEKALVGINGIFLMYPPGENIQFEKFIKTAKESGVQHIVYLTLKDVQFMPFIHHYKNEKLIKKYGVPYTFVRAGYFMQNLNDFLFKEIKERKRIFVPAGKGKTSFVDTRDIAEIAAISLGDLNAHRNKKYVITGDEALDFYEVAVIMSKAMKVQVEYANPTVKEFKSHMLASGVEEGFINVVVGIHFPTKLGLAKGIKYDFEKVTGRKPGRMEQYIEDYKENWM